MFADEFGRKPDPTRIADAGKGNLVDFHHVITVITQSLRSREKQFLGRAGGDPTPLEEPSGSGVCSFRVMHPARTGAIKSG